MTTMKKFWKIRNEADSDRADVLLYGEINADAQLYRDFLGDDTMKSAKMFADDLNALEGKDILLRINSPGGDVFQAQAIYSLLKAYKGDVQCHIDGICASAATVVACAASKITMPQNALFMIHNPAMDTYGSMTAADMEKARDMLDKVREAILTVYSDRADGKTSAEDIGKLMDAETWMNADEAMKYGFVDEVDDYGVAASLTDSNVLVVNGQAMPGIKTRQKEILARLTAKKKVVNNVGKNIFEQFLDFLNGQPGTSAEDIAAVKERGRLAALDAMKGGNEYVNALVDVAKAQNATAEQVKPYADALAAVKPQNQALNAMTALIKDQMNSGAGNVKPRPATEPTDKKAEKRQAEIDAIVALVNGKRG